MQAGQAVEIVTGNYKTFSFVSPIMTGFLEALHHLIDTTTHEVNVANQIEKLTHRGRARSITVIATVAAYVHGSIAQDGAFNIQGLLEILDRYFQFSLFLVHLS